MKKLVYIARDKERAKGLPESENYKILSGNGSEDTIEVLRNSDIPAGTDILVFKNNSQIEKIATEKKLRLLNPSAELSERIENKITQVEWLGELARLLPPHEITVTKNIIYKNKPFILQWAHSHTGDGTFLISKEKELDEIKKKFPEREARVTEYVKGAMFTVNMVVAEEVLPGNISYQITGLSPFTDNPMSTIGNDWSLPHSVLTDAQIKELNDMAILIGKKMKENGWKGLFGIDAIYDEERDKLFLIEINARQPASVTFESQLQSKFGGGITIFEAHLMALTDSPITQPIIEINDGSQIIKRVTKDDKKTDTEKLRELGYKIIEYKNTKLNSDLARIQSEKGIMEAHNKFNKRGQEICDNI